MAIAILDPLNGHATISQWLGNFFFSTYRFSHFGIEKGETEGSFRLIRYADHPNVADKPSNMIEVKGIGLNLTADGVLSGTITSARFMNTSGYELGHQLAELRGLLYDAGYVSQAMYKIKESDASADEFSGLFTTLPVHVVGGSEDSDFRLYSHQPVLSVDLGSGDDRLGVFGLPDSNPTLFGGDGYDYLSFFPEGNFVFLAGGKHKPISSIETVIEIRDFERVYLSNAAATFYGSDNDENFHAGWGDSTLFGGRGNDVLSTGWNGTLFGGNGSDTLEARWGVNAFGGAGFDTLSYSRNVGEYSRGVFVHLENEKARDERGNFDTIRSIENVSGSLNADVIIGSSTKNILHGRVGDDTLRGLAGDDQIFGGLGADIIEAGTGGDKIVGGFGKDNLYGREGDDILIGGNGNDRLNGGSGDDKMKGGSGSDTFTFGLGADVITDFNAANNKEKIDISEVATIVGFMDLKKYHLSENEGNVIIDDHVGNTLTLNGLTIAELDQGDFIL